MAKAEEDEDETIMDSFWAMEGAASSAADCDCGGPPPPDFMLPPPPRPPILQPADPMYCSEDPLPIETCDALPLIDASYRSSPSFQTSAVIVFCVVILGLAIFIGVILVWKHKRRVQNFLPCKSTPQNNCADGSGTAPGVVYEDLHEIMPRAVVQHPQHHHHAVGGHIVAPSMEMIDVKNNLHNIHYPSGYPISTHPPVFLCSSPGPDPYSSQDLYNPVYEELSDAESEVTPAPHSEDEFAEDELSLGGGGGGSGGGHRRHHPRQHQQQLQQHNHRRYRRPHEPLPPIPGSKQRFRTFDHEFHEGMLMDALLQLYPTTGTCSTSSSTTGRKQIPSIAHRLQCDAVPSVIGHLATFRPCKPYSQDSAFGSDSGYSNHTSGTRGSSTRTRRDARRLSQLSADLALG